MATVWLSASDTAHLPDVCVRTGRPTTRRCSFEATAAPGWSGLVLVLGGFLVWVVVRAFASDRVTLKLPVSPVAARRYWRAQLVCGVAVAVGLAVMVAAYAARTGPLDGAGATVVLAGVAAATVVHLSTWVGVGFDRSHGAVIVRRCHPAFVDAVRASRDPAPGPAGPGREAAVRGAVVGP